MPSTAAKIAPALEAEAANDPDARDGARRRGRYASDSMLARRRRMLDAAKAMIAEGGPEGFTIRELSHRAKVSVTTIYATYGDKESLLAAAISDYYQQLPLARAPAPTTLQQVLAATGEARAVAMDNRPYTRHYTELYFSGTVDPRVYAAIRATASASAGQLQWLERVRTRGDMLPGLPVEAITTMLANARLSVLHDWVLGRIPDEELETWMDRGFLLFSRAITCGETQAQVDAELRRLLAEAEPGAVEAPATKPRRRRVAVRG